MTKRYSLLLSLVAPTILGLVTLPFVKWGFSDDDVFILNYLVGRPYPPPIWPDSGRFFPLAHQEWRLLPWLTEAWMFYGIALLGYAVFCFAVWQIVKSKHGKGLSAFFFLVTLPPIVVSFSNIVVLERNQVMFVALWLLCHQAWKNSRRLRFGLLGLLFANLALYYKEPTCLFVGAFAATQLIALVRHRSDLSDLGHHWLDVAVLGSSLVFLLAYFNAVPPLTLLSANAYHGHSFGANRLLPSLVWSSAKEPLLFPLVVGGLCVSVYHYVRGGRFKLEAVGLSFGSFLYAFSLYFAGLSSQYFAALPLFGSALSLYFVLHNGAWRRSSRVFLWCFVLVNLALSAPSLIYKYDWTERNAELTDNLVQQLRGMDQRGVLVNESEAWDTTMFILYAQRVRRLDARFYCTPAYGLPYTTSDKRSLCEPRSESGDLPLKIELGSTYRERGAILAREGTEIWRYQSLWTTWVPESVREALAPHYSFW